VLDRLIRLKDAADRVRDMAGWTTTANLAADVVKNAVVFLEFGAAAQDCGISLLRHLRQLPVEMQNDSAFPALRALVTAIASGSRKKVVAALSGPDSYGALHLFRELAEHVAKTTLITPPKLRKQQKASSSKIAPANRTRPMSKSEAARLMGYVGTDKARVKQLRAAIVGGIVACESRTRQQHVFDLNQFPKVNWAKIMPQQRP
jgi:hypothetical protein